MSAVRRICLVVLGWFIICSAAALPSVQAADSVRAIVISSEIDGSQAALVRRGLELAEESGDTAVVVSIDTMGGRADSRCAAAVPVGSFPLGRDREYPWPLCQPDFRASRRLSGADPDLRRGAVRSATLL